MRKAPVVLAIWACCFAGCAQAATVLVEAESFAHRGGWVVDPQWMDTMGSPYLLAHGLGVPVADSKTTVTLPQAGTYRVFVRTKDWVAPWKAPGAPGRFRLLIDGKPLEVTFGPEGAEWSRHAGGTVSITQREVTLSLHDLTGFEGRCDAVVLTTEPDWVPPNQNPTMAVFRRQTLGRPAGPSEAGAFDLVVVGGGIAGTCASLSAARLGLSVALVQDRPVLGGNNSSEVRVWLQGARNKAPFPRVGDVVAELEQRRRAHYGPSNTAELYEDEKKLSLVRAEPNISLLLEFRVNQVESKGGRIRAVIAQPTGGGRRIRLAGRWFVDSTGDGCVGFLAGADHELTEEGHMGRCNLWHVRDTRGPVSFPRCPWALDLSDKPFPGRARSVGGVAPDGRGIEALGGWYWESGFDHDPIRRGELIRDWNFRAMYGAWDALKNVDGVFPHHELRWAAFISGKRESRRLLGDVVLGKQAVIEGHRHDDGCVPTGWPIDLHLPDPRYEKGFEGDAFIAKAFYTHYQGPYWIPYRCLYSRNVSNLFMAGRDVSVTHEVLGTVRVMRTGGCMGEIVGMAASICKRHDVDPRSVYRKYLGELKQLMARGVGKAPLPLRGKLGRNAARLATVTTSGDRDAAQSPASQINDGQVDWFDNSLRWLSRAETPNWVELRWPSPRRLAAARVISGYCQQGRVTAPISDFVLEYHDGSGWRRIAETATEGNTEVDWLGRFAPITAARVRLLVEETSDQISRIWEIELYEPASPP